MDSGFCIPGRTKQALCLYLTNNIIIKNVLIMACVHMATRTRYGPVYLQSISPPQSMSSCFSIWPPHSRKTIIWMEVKLLFFLLQPFSNSLSFFGGLLKYPSSPVKVRARSPPSPIATTFYPPARAQSWQSTLTASCSYRAPSSSTTSCSSPSRPAAFSAASSCYSSILPSASVAATWRPWP